jgi:hypothetical protein
LTSAFHLGWLLYGYGWAVGMGALSANTHFREGHKYLGPLGYWNSWAAGWFLFYVMFEYGIPAAIAVHFLYDFIIYATLALVFQKGWGLTPDKPSDFAHVHAFVKPRPPRLYEEARR